jgi:hypothetical protein
MKKTCLSILASILFLMSIQVLPVEAAGKGGVYVPANSSALAMSMPPCGTIGVTCYTYLKVPVPTAPAPQSESLVIALLVTITGLVMAILETIIGFGILTYTKVLEPKKEITP